MSHRAEGVANQLLNPDRRVALDRVDALDGLGQPGLYAWFVDRTGASDLTLGLAEPIRPGLIYAGQAGAGSSAATLGSRLRRNHIGGNTRGSTLRFALACILTAKLGLRRTGGRTIEPAGEVQLTDWMYRHLAVAVVPTPDRLRLGQLELEVLARLDPPLNLSHMTTSAIRQRLSSLRSTRSEVTVPSQGHGGPTRRPSTVRCDRRLVAGGLTPEELAADLGLRDAKRVRAFLRANFPRPDELLWSRWGPLDPEAEAAVRRRFGAR
jgi:hypothetical protein